MVEYDKNTIDMLNNWFDEQLKSNFTIEQIKKSMLDNGYNASFVDEVIAEKTGKSNEKPDTSELKATKDTAETQTNSQTHVLDMLDKTNPWQNDAPAKEPNANLTEEQKQEKFKNYSYFDKMKLIITKPKVFFDEMPTTGGYKGPVLFMSINYFLFSIIQLVVSYVTAPDLFSLMGAASLLSIPIFLLGIVFLIGFFISITFLIGGYYHFFFKMFKGQGKYEGTIRALVYPTALLPFSAIPFVNIITGIYSLYISLLGISKIHKISITRALGALIVSAIVLIILLVILAAIIYLTFASIFESLLSSYAGGLMGSPA
ncbi:MAG: YIP1 family protein [Candidatus Aenigmarchaeota archaeon]|nr:YIP1 family protein [Candidatus Aenigmarchaeota archaeon]